LKKEGTRKKTKSKKMNDVHRMEDGHVAADPAAAPYAYDVTQDEIWLVRLPASVYEQLRMEAAGRTTTDQAAFSPVAYMDFSETAPPSLVLAPEFEGRIALEYMVTPQPNPAKQSVLFAMQPGAPYQITPVPITDRCTVVPRDPMRTTLVGSSSAAAAARSRLLSSASSSLDSSSSDVHPLLGSGVSSASALSSPEMSSSPAPIPPRFSAAAAAAANAPSLSLRSMPAPAAAASRRASGKTTTVIGDEMDWLDTITLPHNEMLVSDQRMPGTERKPPRKANSFLMENTVEAEMARTGMVLALFEHRPHWTLDALLDAVLVTKDCMLGILKRVAQYEKADRAAGYWRLNDAHTKRIPSAAAK
jgi:hypothetical protein